MFLPLTIALLLLWPIQLLADFTGPVVSILDGDTIEVLHNTYPERIRLSGIDCPEKTHAYGKRAKQAASELLFGKEVALQTCAKDKQGRTITDVLFPDGTRSTEKSTTTAPADGGCATDDQPPVAGTQFKYRRRLLLSHISNGCPGQIFCPSSLVCRAL